MPHFPIISSSTGFQHKSHRASLYFKKYLHENNLGTSEILDIKKFNFLLEDKLIKSENIFKAKKAEKKAEVEQKLSYSDGIIIVSPVCEGNFPAGFKKIITHLDNNWAHIPVAIATVSSGPFNRSPAVVALRRMLWKIMHTIPAFSMFPKEVEAYDKNGNAKNKAWADKHTGIFVEQLLNATKLNTP